MADNVIWSDMDSGPTPNKGLIVQFKRESKRNVARSNEIGYPVDDPIDRVYVWQAGEKDNVIFDVNELHKRMWPQEWAAYQNGIEQIADGTPLDALFPGSPEVVSTLKANNIHTVQQLANLPDSSAAFKFAGDFRKKAKQFLDGLENNRFPALEQRNAELEAQVRSLMEQMQQVMSNAASTSDDEPARRGPGRPPKQQEVA